MITHTPAPWRWENVAGAGLEIKGKMPDTFTFGEGVIPKGAEVKIFGLPDTIRVYQNGESLIAYERWVRFEPEQWNAMQEANARLIAAAPELLEALRQWKCPACGGTGRYAGYSKDAPSGQTCRKCADTDGLHPIAYAAIAIAKPKENL